MGFQQIAQKYMNMLPPSSEGSVEMPMPKFITVNNLVCKWHGIAIYQNAETVIKVQKKIIQDERTLNRIIAHEICHAWAYWKCFQIKEYDKSKAQGHSSNSAWYEAAKIINQREGADFVTETSDESYVESEERAFYVYVEFGPTGIWWAWFSRVDDNLRRNLMTRVSKCHRLGGGCTVFKTTDSRFLLSGAKLPDAKRLTKTPEDMVQKIHEVITDNPIRERDVDANQIIGRAKTASLDDADLMTKKIKSPGLERLKQKYLSIPDDRLFVVPGVWLNAPLAQFDSESYWWYVTTLGQAREDLSEEEVTIILPSEADLKRLVIDDDNDESRFTDRPSHRRMTITKGTKIIFTGIFEDFLTLKGYKTASEHGVNRALGLIRSPALRRLKELRTPPKLMCVLGSEQEIHSGTPTWALAKKFISAFPEDYKQEFSIVELGESDKTNYMGGMPNPDSPKRTVMFQFWGTPETKVLFSGTLEEYKKSPISKMSGLREINQLPSNIKSPGLTKLREKMLTAPSDKLFIIPGVVLDLDELSSRGSKWIGRKLWEGWDSGGVATIVLLNRPEDYPYATGSHTYNHNPNDKIIFSGYIQDFLTQRDEALKRKTSLLRKKLSGYRSLQGVPPQIKSPGLNKLKEKMDTSMPRIIVIGFGDDPTGVDRVRGGETLCVVGPRSFERLWRQEADPHWSDRIVVVRVGEGDEIWNTGSSWKGFPTLFFKGNANTEILFDGSYEEFKAQDKIKLASEHTREYLQDLEPSGPMPTSFNDWIRQVGGEMEAIRHIQTAMSQTDYDDTGWAPEEGRSSFDEEESERIMFWAWDRYEQVMRDIKALPTPIVAYRTVTLDSLDSDGHPQFDDGVGIFWTLDPKLQNSPWGESKTYSVHMTAEIPHSSIDWLGTVTTRMNYVYGGFEQEIRLLENAPLVIRDLQITGRNVPNEDIKGPFRVKASTWEVDKTAVAATLPPPPPAIVQKAPQHNPVDWWYNKVNGPALERKYGLKPGILKVMIEKESSGNPNARSNHGAVGLFQLTPQSGFKGNPLDPYASAEFAAQMLSRLVDRFGSYTKATAAYNWGESNLARKGLRKAPKETKGYVKFFRSKGYA